MPWTSRAAATLLVASGILLFAVSPTGAVPLTSDPAVASSGAAHWLGTRIGSDGLVESITTPGTPDFSATVYAALGLATSRTGRDEATLAANALSSRVDAYVIGGNPAADIPGNLAYLILLSSAVGQNPRSFGGHDLVARLMATMQTTGADAGLFGSQFAVYDGPFRQGLALAALSLVDPLPAELTGPGGVDASLPVTWLLDQQCADGSWMYRPDTSVPCAFDPNTFAGPDTNATALALLGLLAIDATLTTDQLLDPFAWFDAVQSADGGWSLYGGDATASDPDSTGLVLAAMRSAGEGAPSAPAATTRLLALQFGCDAEPDEQGAFFFPPWNVGDPAVPNLLSTYDALIGLAPGVWPGLLTTGTWTATAPAAPCAPPTTTTTTTTTSAPTTTTTTTVAVTSTTVTTVPVVVEAANTSSGSVSTSGSAPNALAATGQTSSPLAVLGVAMIAMGVALTVIRRRVNA